jgi:hypothetical protein
MRMGSFAASEAILRDGLEHAATDGARRSLHGAFAELYAAWGKPTDAARHRQLAAVVGPRP